ncbi:MAG: PspC domain-containing protein [Tunicatimonas sp.]
MKRTISINISGILFHVEEDGYELLKNYLATINRYFATYEDSQEITNDIESRIAEVFLSKLSPSQQVITRPNVEAVIAAMGSVEDFAAEEVLEEPKFQRRSTYEEAPPYSTTEPKKLHRDTQRKILGGVAAGVAHYFKTDPLWMRLLLLLLLFADAFITFGALSSITLISYIVLWIVLPGRDDMTLDAKVKKLFRNPDDQVLGGVSSGIAAYFGLDATVIRVLFVASIFFGGAGFIAYIVLWIITPPALTLTDKMQMKGEPVTLSNIESSIKKNFRVNDSGEESTLLRAVLFPFRLVSTLVANLGRAVGPFVAFLGDAARVLVGLLLMAVGGTLLAATLGIAGALLGFATLDPYELDAYYFALNEANVPWEVIRATVPPPSLLFGWVALFIPALGLVLGGIAIIIRRRVLSPAVGWSALGVWIIALVGLSVTVVPVITDFREDARYTTTETLEVAGTPILTLANRPDYEHDRVRLSLLGHEDSTLQLRKRFEARGRDRERALENAQMVTYRIQQQDSTLTFPATFTFTEGSPFRDQEVDLTLYVPYGQEFLIDRNLSYILRKSILYRSDLSVSDLQDNTFRFTRQGLECVSCSEVKNLDEQFREQTDSASSKSDTVGTYSR